MNSEIHNLFQAITLSVRKESNKSDGYCGENHVTIWTDAELLILKTHLLNLLIQQ